MNKIQNENKENNILEFESLFLKEFSYFYDYNKNYSGKKMNINDKAKITLKACRFEILHKFKNLNNKKNFNEEIIKRCAYLDFKFKFSDEVEYEAGKSDSNINELVRKYIDGNYVL